MANEQRTINGKTEYRCPCCDFWSSKRDLESGGATMDGQKICPPCAHELLSEATPEEPE